VSETAPDSERTSQTGDRLAGKVAVITGGASGIGAAIAQRFIEEGGRCLLVDIQDEAGRATADQLGDQSSYVHGDVSVEDDVSGAIETALDRYGRLDCMVNNAGILGAVGPIADIGGDAWRRTMAVLLDSVFYGTKHAAKAMIESGRRGGSIINIASTAGVRAGLGPHVYTAAKHGVVGLTQSVAPELGGHGIRVNAIAPGGTVTSITAYVVSGDARDLDAASERVGKGATIGRPAVPRDIANAALFLASEEAAYVSGAVLVVDAAGEVIGDRNLRFVDMGSAIVQEAGRKGL
jgi:NAD(P)-dependent dehydrogenase (short-subunit alcohol dehydrogenase family)